MPLNSSYFAVVCGGDGVGGGTGGGGGRSVLIRASVKAVCPEGALRTITSAKIENSATLQTRPNDFTNLHWAQS